MKIAMATEYFWPHDLGGSEWSTYYLAKELTKQRHKVIIITPNYGSKSNEIWSKLEVFRFPFFKKIKGNIAISPFWHTNIIWIILTTFYLIKVCRQQKVDVLHIQGKYYSPAGFFVKIILGIPVILTARDFQIVCNYGFCLWNKNKACNLREYFSKDFPQYLNNYVNKITPWIFLINVIFAIRARLIRNVYKFFAKRQSAIVCISKFQGKILKENGFSNIKVIYNSMEFKSYRKVKKQNYILFAGRLTPGKGSQFLFEALPAFLKKFTNFKIIVVGEGFLKKKLKKIAQESGFLSQINFLGKTDHKNLMKFFSRASLTIIPSLWQEPFGRVALESISYGTPVVVTNRGGLPEIIGKLKIGLVSDTNPQNLSSNLIEAIERNNYFQTNIQKNFSKLKQKFQIENTQKYINLYKSLL